MNETDDAGEGSVGVLVWCMRGQVCRQAWASGHGRRGSRRPRTLPIREHLSSQLSDGSVLLRELREPGHDLPPLGNSPDIFACTTVGQAADCVEYCRSLLGKLRGAYVVVRCTGVCAGKAAAAIAAAHYLTASGHGMRHCSVHFGRLCGCWRAFCSFWNGFPDILFSGFTLWCLG